MKLFLLIIYLIICFILFKSIYIFSFYYILLNLEIKLFLKNKFLSYKSKRYIKFINHLLKYSEFVNKKNNKNFNNNDIFVNEFLLYRVKNRLNRKIAFFHIRTKQPELLKEKFTFKKLLKDFTKTSFELLNNDISEIKCITHNLIINEKAFNNILKKTFENLNLKVNLKNYSSRYLPWIYAEYLLVYGYDFLLTEEGYNKLIKINKIFIINITK